MDLPRILTSSAVASLLTLAACTTTTPATTTRSPAQAELSDSARALHENARLLASRADAEVRPAFTADAHELEQRSYDFSQAVASGRASDSELRADFESVSRSYHRLRNDVEQANSQQARADLDLVKGPYRDVAARMGEPDGAAGS